MVIDNKFAIGDIVYLHTDTDQSKRIVTGIILTMNSMIYELSCGDSHSKHYDFEITRQVNYSN